MSPVVLVANRSGGVGKSLLAQLVAGISFERRSALVPWSFAPIGVDTVRDLERSKLGRIYPECEELRIAPTLAASEADGGEALWLWHKVAQRIGAGGCVVDFGANAAPLFAQALTKIDHEGSYKPPVLLTLLVPVTASGQALANAREAVEEIGFSTIWHCNIVVVLNEAHGVFGRPGGGSRDLAWIEAKEKERRLKTIRLPRCETQAWSAIEESSCSVFKAMSMTDIEFEQQFKIYEQYRSAQARMMLSSWAMNAVWAMRDAGVFYGAEL